MKHLGDITKISGYDAPVVDCVIGGSPCQGLSNAGKRLGLNDERSGLYMEQIRIVKEMREHDRIRRGADEPVSPRYMVWENVPGAFSTGDPKGADFQAVLEEAIRIAEPEAPSIPIPPKGWNTSGCIVDGLGRWSLSWRITDSQHWGVPQRRRRICMVVDFNGVTAPQIVFGDAELQRSTASAGGNKAVGHRGAECGREVSSVEDSLRGHLEEVEPQGKENAGDAGAGVGVHDSDGEGAVGVDLYNQAVTGDKAKTLTSIRSDSDHVPCVVEPFCKRAIGVDVYNFCETGSVGRTLAAAGGGLNEHIPCVVEPAIRDYKDATDLVVGKRVSGTAGVDRRNACESEELYPTLQAKPNGGQSLNYSGAVRTNYIVRRLTPLECERLQGFPDGWTDIGEWVDSKGKKHKAADSPRYKALGNSIAIPPWKWVLKRICACYERDATMASLFDGIGGFPYIWEQLNGKGSCLWASEIEEFPMAVTKLRLGGN